MCQAAGEANEVAQPDQIGSRLGLRAAPFLDLFCSHAPSHPQSDTRSLIRSLQERLRDRETEGLDGLEVGKKLELCAHFAGEIVTPRVLEIMPVEQRGMDTKSRCSDHGGSPAASNSSRSFLLRAGSAKGTREMN